MPSRVGTGRDLSLHAMAFVVYNRDDKDKYVSN